MRRTTEDGVSMLVGLGVGAAIMYLLDPQSGGNRRRMIAEQARERAANTGQALTDAGYAIAGRARQAMDSASDEISHQASNARGSAMQSLGDLRDRARSWLEPQHSYVAPAAGITAGGIALIALGAGLAYLFDPDRGRGRREYIREQVQGRTHDAGDYARRTGVHLKNKLQGTYYEARKAVGMPVQSNAPESFEQPQGEM